LPSKTSVTKYRVRPKTAKLNRKASHPTVATHTTTKPMEPESKKMSETLDNIKLHLQNPQLLKKTSDEMHTFQNATRTSNVWRNAYFLSTSVE